MVFYFSGTGNCEHIAKLIGERTGEEVIDIAKCLRESRLSFALKKFERLGFVYPIYYMGMPNIVVDFVKAAEIRFYGKHFTYSVASCGAMTGSADRKLSELLKKKNIPMHATFSVRMVSSFTPIFDVKNEERNAKINKEASETVSDMLFLVDNRLGGYYNHRIGPWPVSPVVHAGYTVGNRTSFFKLSKDCTGCGICADECPQNAIEIVDGKAKWTKKRCTYCLGCIHKCPQNAVSLGLSKIHGQYVYKEEE